MTEGEQSGDVTGWFDRIYSSAGRDGRAVPWANLTAHPDFSEWVQQSEVKGAGRRALVVGCGLGDDAEAVADLGFEVTAFDVAPTAIDWCSERFPDSKVSYQVADLFETPQEWNAAFDFVLEVRTVQSLPPEIQEMAIEQIARFPAPGGTLLVSCIARKPATKVGGPPWPLARPALEGYLAMGLEQVEVKETVLRREPMVWNLRIEYRRSAEIG